MTVYTNRAALVAKVAELLKDSKSEVMLMGRHVAWIRDEGAFHAGVQDALSRGVTVRVLSYRPQTRSEWSKAFESLGARIRYFNHGDIRVLIFDRKVAVLGFRERPTEGLGRKQAQDRVREQYDAIETSATNVVHRLCQRFDEMWDKGRKEQSEAGAFGALLDFLREQKSEIAVATFSGLAILVLTLVIEYAFLRK